jgi:outer membrane protein assembly factor BamB
MRRIILLVLLIALHSTVAAQGQSWPMYQADSRHTGYVPVTLDPELFAVRWSKVVGSGKALNPVTAADGKVFVSLVVYFDDIPSLFVLNSNNGDELWNKSFGSVNSVNPPSYAYGNVYVQTGNHSSDTYLRAYNADTGTLVFRSAHSAQWDRYYAPTIYDGKVYINGGYYGGMYTFDAYTGSELWFTDLNGYDEWTPAVDGSYAYAYLGTSTSGDGTAGLSALNKVTGAVEFRINDPNFDWHGWSMDLAPVLSDDGGAFVIQNSRLIKFDTAARNISWELDQNFTGQPSLANGVVYVINSGALSAIDSSTGTTLWSWEAPSDSLSGSLIVTDSHVIVGSSSKTYAVDLNTKSKTWEYAASGHLSLSNDALYIAAEDGTLTCIEQSHGPDIIRELPANTWLMTAPPCTPDPAGITDQYGDDLSGTYGIDWISFKWDADSAPQQYIEQTGTDMLELGFGNWNYSLNAGTLDVSGTPTPTTDCTLYGLAGQCFAVDLVIAPSGEHRWNMLGHPFPHAVDWADVKVLVSSSAVSPGSPWTVYSPSEAETAGYISKTYHTWNGSSYDSYDDSTPGAVGILQPQEGFWVKSLGSYTAAPGKIQLLIPAQ